MKARRVTELGVHNLELVFAPIGLPLIEKASPETPTTSVLVRGGAGAGKTTLAVALAQSIARETQGFALYLTTEFVPTELSFKATLLGLEESIVMPWQERGRAAVGTIAVEHLALLTEPEALLSSEGRKRSALDAVWELLEAREVETSAPIRAVVIDAFTLPDPGQNEAALRADFVSFVQALEDRGISTVLIEEQGAGAADWLSFVVDVVFELGFAEEKETGALHRKLVCRKSRYARALPGPHDYGLDPEQRPSVWPDLLAVVSADKNLPFAVPKERRARMVVPISKSDLHTIVQGGNIIVNTYEESEGKFIDALHATPGISKIQVRSGSLSQVYTPQGIIEILDDAGPHALGGIVAHILASTRANTVFFDNLEALLAQTQFRVQLFHVIEAFRHLGYMVCLHGSSAGLAPFVSRADIMIDGVYRNAFKISSRNYLFSAIWLIELKNLDSLTVWSPRPHDHKNNSELDYVQAVRAALAKSAIEIHEGNIRAALEVLSSPWHKRSKAGLIKAPTKTMALTDLAIDLARYRLGVCADPRLTLTGPTWVEEQPSLVLYPALAWTYALMGDDSKAIHYCFDAYATSVERADLRGVLWAALNAVHAESDAAIDALHAVRGKLEEPFIFGFLLRALARKGRFDELDQAAASYQERHKIPDYLVPRLQADARLESKNPAILADARARLALLATDERLPVIHRAEVMHNLGYAHEELKDIEEAKRCYREASLLNPYLQMAKDALARLGELEQPDEPEKDSALKEEP